MVHRARPMIHSPIALLGDGWCSFCRLPHAIARAEALLTLVAARALQLGEMDPRQGAQGMEIRQLRHFCAIAELGGFGIAAEHLNMSQPALSKSIRALETSLAVTLMDRGPGGLKLTSYGERLIDYARAVLQLTEEARDEMDAMRGARRGKLNIGAITTAQRTILPTAISAFLRTHPDIELRVNEELNNGLVDMLQAGQIDIAIVSRPVQPLPEAMELRVIAATQIVLAVDPLHPLAQRESVSLADLGPYEWIVPPRPEPDRLNLEYLFASESLPAPKVRVETTSAVFQASILAGTDQISYMTASSQNLRENGGFFASLNLNRTTWLREICAVTRRTGSMRPVVRAFLRELAATHDMLNKHED